MAYPHNIREEELKNHIAREWVSAYDTTHILGDIDFSVAVPKEDSNPNASLYDIRLYFQGTKTFENGKNQMDTESSDDQYTILITVLRDKLKALAKKIEPKIYQYGFLK